MIHPGMNRYEKSQPPFISKKVKNRFIFNVSENNLSSDKNRQNTDKIKDIDV